MQELAEFIIAFDIIYKGEGLQWLLDQLNIHTYFLSVLEQIDWFSKNQT